mgnify:CR=1 FL=1
MCGESQGCLVVPRCREATVVCLLEHDQKSDGEGDPQPS